VVGAVGVTIGDGDAGLAAEAQPVTSVKLSANRAIVRRVEIMRPTLRPFDALRDIKAVPKRQGG
jgi:hypothetical protein